MKPRSNPLRWLVAIAVVLACSVLSLRHYLPPLPSPLTFDLVLENYQPGKNEPIIVSGRERDGDFLFIRHLENNAIAFGYEYWGHPSELTRPLPLPADRRVRVQLEMPALTQIRGVFARHDERLRLVANGTELFNAKVDFHVRAPTEISFGRNPIGGTACDERLSGKLLLPDGRELHGLPTPLFTFRDRLMGWLAVSKWQAICALLAGVVTLLLFDRVRGCALRDATAPSAGVAPIWAQIGNLWRALSLHRWFWVTAGLCTFSFTWMLTGGTFHLIYPELFGNFFDYQAMSLLQGRLDVPDEAISGEAFVVDGKRYGYFGITPALLRLPFVIFGIHFGEVSRLFMVGYYVVTLVGCYLILGAISRLAGRSAPAPSRWATLCFVGGVGAGSTVYYLASRAYIYHEAILCGVMFAVLGCWCALRHVATPAKRWWVASLLCGVLSIHARPPTGLFALTFLGAMAIVVLLPRANRTWAVARRQLSIAAFCGLGVFSFNVLSYLKFKTFEGCPLRLNVQYNANRLARIDGKQFHLANIPIAIDSYLVHPNFRLESGFPYFFIGDLQPRRPWLKTKIDYHENTLGFPYAMPGLFALATLGGVTACRRLPTLRSMIVATWLAAIPLTLAMFAAIAITQRYTADFCPFLVVAAAFGVVAIESAAALSRGLMRFTVSAGTIAAVLITFAITLHYQGQEVWGVPDDVRIKYGALRRAVDAVVDALRR